MTSPLWELKKELLKEGVDLVLDDAEVARVVAALPAGGPVPPDALAALVEMRTEARRVSPAFDAVLFPALKAAFLADGKIDPAERFTLLRMLYGGGGIDSGEREFLRQLRAEATEVSEEFELFYEQVMRDYHRSV